MASSMVKSTRKTLNKTVKKTVKGTVAAKAVKDTAKAVKDARRALGKASGRTKAAGLAAAGVVTTAGTAVLLRRRRADSAGEQLNDPTLARKVESEIFRPAGAPPKSQISVNVEHGVVYLRGQVDDADRAKALEKAARAVDGVKDVQNLLHTPGTPAPAKTESHDDVERPVN